LVVEDNSAAEEVGIRERRKGEPASRGSGLRKVYRREFDPSNDVGGGGEDYFEVQGQEAAVETSSTQDQNAAAPDFEWENPGDPVVTRAVTPPLHARIVDVPGSNDDNPWA